MEQREKRTLNKILREKGQNLTVFVLERAREWRKR